MSLASYHCSTPRPEWAVLPWWLITKKRGTTLHYHSTLSVKPLGKLWTTFLELPHSETPNAREKSFSDGPRLQTNLSQAHCRRREDRPAGKPAERSVHGPPRQK